MKKNELKKKNNNMTRDERIINAAREYTDTVIFASPSTVLHFEAGAKWADQHPKNVWHDANEKPNCGSDVIALDHDNITVYGTFKDDDDYGEYIYRCHGFSCEIFEYEYVTKWAYIKDLLPKGGEK